jgi:hypothetical protein
MKMKPSKKKNKGWSRKLLADVRRVRALPPETLEERGSDYTPDHTLVGRSLACGVCGALGSHNCVPVMVEYFFRSPTLQNAYFELVEAYSQNPQFYEELEDNE